MHELIILIAKYFIIIPVLTSLWLLVRTPKDQRIKSAAVLVLGGILSVVFAKIASHLYYDPRPFVYGPDKPFFSHGPDNGFPSDHTLLSAYLAYWSLLRNRVAGIGLFVVALLIGVSRVAAHIHHLHDIIGSLLIAALGLMAAYGVAYLAYRPARHKPAE